MTESYLIHSNRQHHSDIELERVFEEVNVASTFSDKEEWGEQLEELDEGDRVLMYDQPSQQYLAAGVVTDPWEGDAITDPERKVIPGSDIEEYHVGIAWDNWFSLGDGYDREVVNRALGYDEVYAPQQAVVSIDYPSEDRIERTYSAISEGQIPGVALSPKQERILEKWSTVASTQPAGSEFDFANHDRTETISSRAQEFLNDPSEERFKQMWDRMHSAIRRGKAERILEKWAGSTEDLKNIIQEMYDDEEYNDEWEDTLGGETTVRELYGSLHIDTHPILNSAAENGLMFFGFDEPRSFEEGSIYFSQFLAEYKQIVGHATANADHGVEVPIRLEIDQLFNVIDKVDESSKTEDATNEEIDLYNAILAAKGELSSEESSIHDIGRENASAYWVNQENQAEITDGYLRAKTDGVWHHNLDQLTQGDLVFHNYENELIGISVVTDQSEAYSFRGEEYLRVEVDFHWFEEPLTVNDELKKNLNKEKFQTDEYYPFDKNNDLKQAYLSNLSEEAAEFLINQVSIAEKDNIDTLGESDTDDTKSEDAKPNTFQEWQAERSSVFETGPDGISSPDLVFDANQEEKLLNRIQSALENGKHVILTGPPGTGKTKLARHVARHYVGEDHEMVTASSDWSTFDTIGGYRPETDRTLEFHPGVFLDRYMADDQAIPTNEWLIIDELNRADIDKAFGALFSALTGETITLPFDGTNGDPVTLVGDPEDEKASELTQNHYFIPQDWRLLATMNTYDKTSLYQMSYAFMRRFAFVPVSTPTQIDDSLIQEYSEEWFDELVTDEVAVLTADLWETINEVRAIGPAIIRDMLSDVRGKESPDFTDAVIMYVMPQLEGLPKSKQRGFPAKVATLNEDDKDVVDVEQLNQFVREYFEVEPTAENES